MHEMSLIDSVLRSVTEEAALKGFAKVKTVWLEVGKLSCVEPEALSFCFEALAPSSICEGAELKLTETAGTAFCPACQKESEISRYGAPCPECGEYGLEIKSGDKVFIKQIEVEDEGNV
ncbi:MAG: hydrogenase maturation nickel metallochaperone HypA [Alphaproteobacteria bacterium]|nr:hydrogenase maturation nickel metallochaperone HypA [Alphaproteobacteria bacterium]